MASESTQPEGASHRWVHDRVVRTSMTVCVAKPDSAREFVIAYARGTSRTWSRE
jgi:hypothetical protein